MSMGGMHSVLPMHKKFVVSNEQSLRVLLLSCVRRMKFVATVLCELKRNYEFLVQTELHSPRLYTVVTANFLHITEKNKILLTNKQTKTKITN